MNNVLTLKNARAQRVDDKETAPALTIGQRIVSRRRELDISQEYLAAAISFKVKESDEAKILSRPALSMYETDKIVPNLHNLEEIAHALNVTPAWLAWGDVYAKESKATRGRRTAAR